MALTSKATVRSEGGGLQVELEKELRRDLSAGAELEAISLGADALWLLHPGALEKGVLGGSLQAMSVAEVMQQLVAGVRTGRLIVATKGARRTVTFRDGQITFATSSAPYERLGQALTRLGVVSRAEMDAALKQVGPGKKLGQVLTGTGRVRQPVLYGAMTFLVREIAVELVQQTEGAFLFLEGAPRAEDVLRLPERTRDLLLEGIRRADEAAALRARYPVTMRVSGGGQPLAPEREALATALAGGTAVLGVLRTSYPGSDHAFWTAVDEAVRAGELVVTHAKAAGVEAPRPAERRSTLELYGGLVTTICAALRDAGKDLGTLRAFLEDPQPGTEQALRGVTLTDDGVLDVEQVLRNLAALGPVIRRVRAHEALNAFISFALFAAKNQLPAAKAHALDQKMADFMEKVSG